MATKTTAKAKTGTAKKAAAPKKKAAPKAKPAAKAAEGSTLDRKGLAARARQLKAELLAVRFNPQSPSLNEYRKKRRELASVLSQLS